MNIKEITKKIVKVSDTYAKAHSINRDKDWYFLKIQEELWELTQAYLSFTKRWRDRGKSNEELKSDFSDELADVIGHVILMADKHNIDIEKALEDKWFKYLK